ncbi:MAG: PTS sugar transporter subunit IIA [Syntrophorhabdaceae bacterium]|nr:PTS sugar transporter subunit IIA [Syntrophorhabdaceae bacterium]
MKLIDVLKENCILADLKGETKREVIEELVYPLKEMNLIEEVDEAVNVVLEREKLGSTGIGEGIAIPHGKYRGINDILCVFGKSKKGVDFDAIDRKPVYMFFLILTPEDAVNQYLKTLSRISKMLRDPSFKKRLMELDSPKDIYDSIVEEDSKI